MAENKTQPTEESVEMYLSAISDPERRADARALAAMMTDISGEPAVMWGPAIVGFGHRAYVYASGRKGTTPHVGFASRSAALTIYGCGVLDLDDPAFGSLGKFKVGKGCLYIKRLRDVDLDSLRTIISAIVAESRALPLHIDHGVK